MNLSVIVPRCVYGTVFPLSGLLQNAVQPDLVVDALYDVPIGVVPTGEARVSVAVVVDVERVGATAADELRLQLLVLDFVLVSGADRAGAQRLAGVEVRRRRVEVLGAWRGSEADADTAKAAMVPAISASFVKRNTVAPSLVLRLPPANRDLDAGGAPPAPADPRVDPCPRPPDCRGTFPMRGTPGYA